MRFTLLLAIFCVLTVPVTTNAETTPAMEIGLRGGFDSNSSNADEHYDAVELYFFRALPWGARLIGNTTLSTRFDLGETYLEGGDDEGAMLAAGVDLVLGGNRKSGLTTIGRGSAAPSAVWHERAPHRRRSGRP